MVTGCLASRSCCSSAPASGPSASFRGMQPRRRYVASAGSPTSPVQVGSLAQTPSPASAVPATTRWSSAITRAPSSGPAPASTARDTAPRSRSGRKASDVAVAVRPGEVRLPVDVVLGEAVVEQELAVVGPQHALGQQRRLASGPAPRSRTGRSRDPRSSGRGRPGPCRISSKSVTVTVVAEPGNQGECRLGGLEPGVVRRVRGRRGRVDRRGLGVRWRDVPSAAGGEHQGRTQRPRLQRTDRHGSAVCQTRSRTSPLTVS